mgnify:CR=1 FL=1
MNSEILSKLVITKVHSVSNMYSPQNKKAKRKYTKTATFTMSTTNLPMGFFSKRGIMYTSSGNIDNTPLYKVQKRQHSLIRWLSKNGSEGIYLWK